MYLSSGFSLIRDRLKTRNELKRIKNPTKFLRQYVYCIDIETLKYQSMVRHA